MGLKQEIYVGNTLIEIGDFGWCTCVRLVWASGMNWSNNSLWWNKTMQAHFCWCGIKNGVRKWLKRNSTTWTTSPPSKFVYEVHNQQGAMQWTVLKEAIWKDATLFNFNFISLEGYYCVSFGVVFCSSIKMFMNYVQGNNLCFFPCWLCLLSTNVNFAWLL